MAPDEKSDKKTCSVSQECDKYELLPSLNRLKTRLQMENMLILFIRKYKLVSTDVWGQPDNNLLNTQIT